jgi:hypothetical protein
MASIKVTCLIAECSLHGNGKHGSLADIYQSTEHGALSTCNLCPPCSEYLAALVLRHGTKQPALIQDDAGGEEELAAGGAGRELPIAGAERCSRGWLRYQETSYDYEHGGSQQAES